MFHGNTRRHSPFVELLENRRLLTALLSGHTVQGNIALVGQADSYTLPANAGDSISIAMAETIASFFSPLVEVFAPDNTLLATNSGSVGTGVDLVDLPQSGTYTVIARDAGDDHTGSYALTAVWAPAQQMVDNDSGPISSGLRRTGGIARGDLDVYTFSANAGDSIAVAMGELGSRPFAPAIRLHAPDGSLVSSSSGPDIARVDVTNLPQSGTYYIIVRDLGDNDIGDYGITVVRLPAAQPVDGDSGPIASGQRRIGSVDPGDLDVYTFSADAGASISVVLGDAGQTTFSPSLRVYASDGSLVGSRENNIGASVDAANLALGGTYYIIVGDRDSTDDLRAEYALSLAVLPGPQQPDTLDNDGGALTSAQTVSGAITLGDLDVYTLDLNAAGSTTIQINDLSATNPFAPRIDLFGPDGVRLDTQSGGASATIALASAPMTGTYSLVVRDFGDDNSGNYSIGIDVVPGPDTRPPQVTQARFDIDVPNQRLVFSMNESIGNSLASADLILQNLTDNSTIPSANIFAEFRTTCNEIVFQFLVYPFAALPDGNYRATLQAGSVADTAGNLLPQDVVFEFSFLQGDANRDGRVTLDDFNILAANFGQVGRKFTQGNFTYDPDGRVDLDDFNILASRFGTVLPPAVTSAGGVFAAARKIGSTRSTLDELE